MVHCSSQEQCTFSHARLPASDVWQRARELAVAIDGLSRAFPRRDRGVASDLSYVSEEIRERLLGQLKIIQRMLAKLIANLP
jgi:hypothetical protein